MAVNLPAFYQTFAEEYEDIGLLIETYQEVCDLVLRYMQDVADSEFLGRISTYNVVPQIDLAVGGLVYDLRAIMAIPSVYTALGISDMTIDERLLYWVESGRAINADKISVLRKLGYYASLEAPIESLAMGTDLQGVLPRQGRVVWLDLYDGENKLQPGVDYVLEDGRVYLVGDIAMPSNRAKVLQMCNIALDFSAVENRFGKLFNLVYTGDISLNEYNEIVQKLARLSLTGPRIKNLREAVLAIAGIEEIDIYDKYIINPEHQALWLREEQTVLENFILLPFDYIVEIYNENGLSQYRIDMLTSYLKTVSPITANFAIRLNLTYYETYDLRRRANDAYLYTWQEIDSETDVLIRAAPTEEILNNPDKDLNVNLDLFLGSYRSDEPLTDTLIPV